MVLARLVSAAVLGSILLASAPTVAQTPSTPPATAATPPAVSPALPAASPSSTIPGWRGPGTSSAAAGTAATGSASSSGSTVAPIEPLRPITNPPRKPLAQVTQGPPSLPNEQGQVWREYNISPYTLRVTSTNHPEQAVVDWILRETGYEAWHSEPLGILSANSRTLKVYHTPEMHAVVSDVVDRFVNSEAESNAFGLRVITVGSPNWRVKAHPMLHPVAVQSQGIQAWLVQKEDAALILAEMRRRIDFREHSSPHLLVNNGQSSTVALTRARSYARDAVLQPQVWPGFQTETAQFDEGFTFELSPLLSLDGRTVDAVVKCNIDQLEKLVSVTLDVPTAVAPRQHTKIEVPQTSHCRLHERFRWPTDQVLIIDLGVVPPPMPSDPNPLSVLPIFGSPPRADLLVFIESKGKMLPAATTTPAATAPREAKTYRGRY